MPLHEINKTTKRKNAFKTKEKEKRQRLLEMFNLLGEPTISFDATLVQPLVPLANEYNQEITYGVVALCSTQPKSEVKPIVNNSKRDCKIEDLKQRLLRCEEKLVTVEKSLVNINNRLVEYICEAIPPEKQEQYLQYTRRDRFFSANSPTSSRNHSLQQATLPTPDSNQTHRRPLQT